MSPIIVSSQGPPISSAVEYLQRSYHPPTPPSNETPLLLAIRSALRGSDTDASSSIHSSVFVSKEDPCGRELTWNAKEVVLSYGGVMVKKWNFKEDIEDVQWACLGLLKENSLHSSAHATYTPIPMYNSSKEAPGVSQRDANGRPTFGPFGRGSHESKAPPEIHEVVPAVFIFLRSLGRIYLQNGTTYVVNVPFIVRRAWPVSPHGVMIQRVLEPSELVEAELTGDAVLPTIFTMTSGLTEVAAVGLATGIVGGYGGLPVTLKDEDEKAKRVLRSIPPTEMVVWTPHEGSDSKDDIVVTVDVGQHTLSIWRYVFATPNESNVNETPPKTTAKKRQSLAGHNRRTSTAFGEGADRLDSKHAMSPPREQFQVGDLPPLPSFPAMPSSLSAATTMSSILTGTTSSQSSKTRRNSLSRNDLSMTMDKMALERRRVDPIPDTDDERMKSAYWMERVYSEEIPEGSARSWRAMSIALFDNRWDGTTYRSLLAITLPESGVCAIFSLSYGDDKMMKVNRFAEVPGVSVTSILATRKLVYDLLVVQAGGELIFLTHGIQQIPIRISDDMPVPFTEVMEVDDPPVSLHGCVIGVEEAHFSSVTLIYEDGWKSRISLELYPQDTLTTDCLQLLSLVLPLEMSFTLHRTYLENWSSHNLSSDHSVQFECFKHALYDLFDLRENLPPPPSDPWFKLAQSSSHYRFHEEPALRLLKVPPKLPSSRPVVQAHKPHRLMGPVMYALHSLGEHLRVLMHRYDSVVKLAGVICRIALPIRPEWADFWKRLVPDAMDGWPHPAQYDITHIEDHIPVWPLDIMAILYGTLNTPDWKIPWHDVQYIAKRFHTSPSFAYGLHDPLKELHDLTVLYGSLSDVKVPEAQKRAENAIFKLVTGPGFNMLRYLPLGVAAPLREAARTCQLAPPVHWPLEVYRAIGRNDLAACASEEADNTLKSGYRPPKDFINPPKGRVTIGEIVAEAKASAGGEVDVVSGVELNLDDFTEIRFGQDRRLEEVARLLSSSITSPIRVPERNELSEHDQTKEHQAHVLRVSERTLALPYGRAMFTYGCVSTVTRESHAIPKIEYSIRILPFNITVNPEPGKVPPESISWGEFHNGVAAGLRISPQATGVESSWISFNKPAELTPEHGGFLFGLGLTGHLKKLMTWNTFSYLSPKHDLTTIGVLLGLSAANLGKGTEQVVKLLAVHTPALLPSQDVDLNVPLLTQSSGLSGVGLLYLGTKNRRMAETCLGQISRRDLLQPDLSNEHREAYTFAAALSFGMIMLGKGTAIPADLDLLNRLNILVHGDINLVMDKKSTSPFDLNLASPAASIAVGLMYLKTERQDVADTLTIPDTAVTLHRIQPSFLMIRTIARSLIMWDKISPTNEWIVDQVPTAILKASETSRLKAGNDAFDLAYYNIVAGSCFAIGLKYAGTARQEAYQIIVRYYDMFSKYVFVNSGPAYDMKIKRAALRDGLNQISIALSMVMAGTGEISCLRRIRFAYGMFQQNMYHPNFRYGVHVATVQSLGLLFLGGGRYTLGTSDAAIACMVTAFFPRTHIAAYDNKCFLQALRHLWVLAVEPRCLIARDVDTGEVVYLPVKITVREGNEVGSSQLISPTLIPDVDKLMSIRVDTPRYWPFYLDLEALPRHREALLRNQTLYVKRRTAFLSYTEDPRGSRSLFVRSGSSAGDAAILDFPQLREARTHPAGDLSEFITSFSNNVLFLAFADRLCRFEEREQDDIGDEERMFHTYCHAALLDSIMQDKPQTLQTHLTLYRYRSSTHRSRYFFLRYQDLKFAAEFYGKVYDRRFSGRQENNPRPGLIRDTAVSGALHRLDAGLEDVRQKDEFKSMLAYYVKGEDVGLHAVGDAEMDMGKMFAWYLLKNSVPASTVLYILKDLSRIAHAQSAQGLDAIGGVKDISALDVGIREILHVTGMRMTTSIGAGWSVRSLDEVIEAWNLHS